MLVKSIYFRHNLEDITGIEDENIDVSVELEDGHRYIVTVGTAKNIEYLMDKDKMNYFEPGDPFIIVKKLTKDIIEETVKAYAENDNGYWLKLHHFAGLIDETVFDKLRAEDNARNEYTKYLAKYLDKLDELYEKYRQKLNELNRFDNS